MDKPITDSIHSTIVRDERIILDSTSCLLSNSILLPRYGPSETCSPVHQPITTISYRERMRSRSCANPVVRASSRTSSNTMYDEDLNEVVVETWSGPTQSGSDDEPVDECIALIITEPSTNVIAQTSSDMVSYALGGDNLDIFSAEMRSSHIGHAQPNLEHMAQPHTPSDMFSANTSIAQALPSTTTPTLIDVGLNELMAESWSQPTRAGSIDAPIADTLNTLEYRLGEVFPKGIEDWLHPSSSSTKISSGMLRAQEELSSEEELARSNHTPNGEGSIYARHATESDGSWTKNCLEKLGTHHALRRYLMGDPSEAPWTIYHLKVSVYLHFFTISR